MSTQLTVLICTHDRAALLQRVLDSLDRARRPQALQVEVLVVANACSDATHALLEQRAQPAPQRLPLRWVIEPRPGKSHALNRGAAEPGAPWLAIVDDDHRVDGDFLLRIGQALQAQPQADLLCGRILPDWDGSEPAWVHDTGCWRIYPLPIPRQEFGDTARELHADGPLPGGGNQIVRRDVLQRLGGFSAELGPQGHDLGGGEDLDFVLRALRAGLRLWHDPAIVQYHYVDPARLQLGYLMHKACQRSASSVQLNAAAHDAGATAGVPRYLYRKLAGYLLRAALALPRSAPRRFWLVRCAAAWGEMTGFRRLRDRAPATLRAGVRNA